MAIFHFVVGTNGWLNSRLVVNQDLLVSGGYRRSCAKVVTDYRGMTGLAKMTERAFPI
jgi:hypothetical protein